ncbi:hypothetical protein N7492_007823 [Penicillium capsulatum]|uniref:ATP-dependent DNA helicase CHL1 n=1 Tax=Penicillium capsulatum TaxID=69766 RepID=A0A9W9I2M3_9EURO|nr:hypothetical protein N7492_007823 [Penicillium capsulatum]
MELQDFHHPFTPYDIQLEFMRALYGCLEEGKVAVFESPTGETRKLRSTRLPGIPGPGSRYDSSDGGDAVAHRQTGDEDEPEWMLEFAKKDSRRTVAEKRREFEARLAQIKQAEERLKQAQGSHHDRPLDGPDPSEGEDDSQFVLDDYDSESEQRKPLGDTPGMDGLSASTRALLERFQGQLATQKVEEEEDDGVKIFYCSRTHSQLSQFAGELRRVAFPSSLPADLEVDGPDDLSKLEERIKHLSLGSRKNLCINPKVRALENSTAINERCLDLQQPGVAADKKCSYLPTKDDEALMLEFRDHALATVKDIEDIGKVGKQLEICPYYASRSVIKHSEIVTLPYPLLLQRSAREALNLSVKNHVVIIDEAHNLMDAIAGIHSVTVSLSQLQTAITQLTTYARKFKNRLKGKNRSYVAQVIRLVSSIADHLRGISQQKGPAEGSVQASDLMAGKGVDQINPYKLSRYLQESKLARKVDGYVESSEQSSLGRTKAMATVPVLFHIQSFLLPLMNPSEEGRLFYNRNQEDVQLRYMLLDPTNHFREIVEDARAVILAGGTMSPVSLDFPYDYLSQVLDVWKKPIPNGNGQSTLALIERKKKVLYESREAVTSTDALLQEYTAAVESGSGALLLSVVGGKLSEGINFSDKLGRGVLIIGLPFPNIRSAVWQAKIKYIEEKTYKQSSGSESERRSSASAAGRDFYENSCMRAVNQCIGRAIRHVNDYAAIIMIDRRYDTPRVQGKLPGWIRGSLVPSPATRPAQVAVQRVSKFFANKV